MHRNLHNFRLYQRLAPKEMHVQVGRSPATDRLSHPVHGGRGGAKVHAARLRPASPKIAVVTGAVAPTCRNDPQERGLNGSGTSSRKNRIVLDDVAPQAFSAVARAR